MCHFVGSAFFSHLHRSVGGRIYEKGNNGGDDC